MAGGGPGWPPGAAAAAAAGAAAAALSSAPAAAGAAWMAESLRRTVCGATPPPVCAALGLGVVGGSPEERGLEAPGVRATLEAPPWSSVAAAACCALRCCLACLMPQALHSVVSFTRRHCRRGRGRRGFGTDGGRGFGACCTLGAPSPSTGGTRLWCLCAPTLGAVLHTVAREVPRSQRVPTSWIRIESVQIPHKRGRLPSARPVTLHMPPCCTTRLEQGGAQPLHYQPLGRAMPYIRQFYWGLAESEEAGDVRATCRHCPSVSQGCPRLLPGQEERRAGWLFTEAKRSPV